MWLEQRGLDGLWSGLWELPSGEGPTSEAALAALNKKVEVDASKGFVTVHHTLTHRDVEAVIYPVDKLPRNRSKSGKRYTAPLDAPLSGLARKAIVGAKELA